MLNEEENQDEIKKKIFHKKQILSHFLLLPLLCVCVCIYMLGNKQET